MENDIDTLAREAFARMVAEEGNPTARAIPPQSANPRPSLPGARAGRAARPRIPAAIALIVVAFCAIGVMPPLAARGRPRFAERAALLPGNAQLYRYAELLSDSVIPLRNRYRSMP